MEIGRKSLRSTDLFFQIDSGYHTQPIGFVHPNSGTLTKFQMQSGVTLTSPMLFRSLC